MSLSYSLSTPQRHSDMCAVRQPLSPLYDTPCSPEIYSVEEALSVVSGSATLAPYVCLAPAQVV